MVSGGGIDRRTFLKAVGATSVATAAAAGADPKRTRLRLQAMREDSRLVAVVFHFSDPAEPGEEYSHRVGIKDFAVRSAGPDKDAPTVAIERLSINDIDDAGYLRDGAQPRIVFSQVDVHGYVAAAGHGNRYIFDLIKLRADDGWRVRFSADIWWKRSGGKLSPRRDPLEMPAKGVRPPLLIDILRSSADFVLKIGPGWTAPTFSRILGLAIAAPGEVDVSFGCRAAGWLWSLPAPAGRSFGLLDGRLRFTRLQFGVMRRQDRMSVFHAATEGLFQPADRRTWTAPSGSVLTVDLDDPTEPPTILSTAFTFNSDAQGTGIDRTARATFAIAPATLRITLATDDVRVLQASAILRGDGVTLRASDMGVGDDVMILDVSLKDVEDGGLFLPAFGRVPVSGGDNPFKATLTGVGIARFQLSPAITSLPVALTDEDGDLISSLRWDVPGGVRFDYGRAPYGALANRPVKGATPFHVVASLRGVKVEVALDTGELPPQASEGESDAAPGPEAPVSTERAVEAPWDTIILDAVAGDDPTGDDPAIHVALDAARLSVRRPSDGLALEIGFFNVRLRHNGTAPMLISIPVPPDRPIAADGIRDAVIAFEVPGGHVLKEAFARQTITTADFPDVGLAASKNHVELAERLEALRHATPEERARIRRAIQEMVIGAQGPESETVRRKIAALEAGLRAALSSVPKDQFVYLGPDFMDRDVRRVAERLLSQDDTLVRSAIGGLLARLAAGDDVQAIRSLREGQPEPEIERAVTETLALRDPVYAAMAAAMPADGLLLPFVADWNAIPKAVVTAFARARAPKFPRMSRARQGGASRICILWDTRTGAMPATPFSLAALLDWRRADLSVPPRARRTFEIVDGRRVATTDDARTLAEQGIRPNPAGTLASRAAEVYAAASRPVRAHETDLELISRVHFAVYDDAALILPMVVPPSVFDLNDDFDSATAEQRHRPSRPLWSISIAADAPNAGLIATASPDFRPEAYLRLSGLDVVPRGDLRPTAQQLRDILSPPPRGPMAPWLMPRPRLVEGEVVVDPPPPDADATLPPAAAAEAEFRTSISSYFRHGLVDHGTPGRPGSGTPSDGTLEPNPTASFLAPPGYALVDVLQDDTLGEVPIKIDQTILRQQRLAFSEVTITPMGPSVAIEATLAPAAPAKRVDGARAYQGTSLRTVKIDATTGEETNGAPGETGYLFPLGHLATRTIATRPTVALPSQIDGRSLPAVYSVQRTLIEVSQPIKTVWIDQPFAGSEWPARSVEIVTRVTPDLVAPDLPHADPNKPVAATGRLYLGAGTSGLVFWPRIVAAEGPQVVGGEETSGIFRFDVRIDGAAETVSMPLIFVSFDAVMDEAAMGRLVYYWNSLPIDRDDRLDPNSLRVATHGAARRRYAPEIVEGDTTYETLAWAIGAQGRLETSLSGDVGLGDIKGIDSGRDLITGRAAILETPADDFSFGPLLAAADQPPFYPFLQRCALRLDRLGRMAGQTAGIEVEAAYDKAFIVRTSDDTPVDQPDVVLGMIGAPRLDIGANGDRVGGIARPSGTLIALSRREGPIMSKSLSGATAASATKPTAILARLRSAAREPSQTAQDGSVSAPPPTLDGLVKDLVGDTVLLGFVPVSEIVTGAIGALADNIPSVSEAIEYGDDLIKDGADVLRNRIIEPLAEIVAEIYRRFEATSAAVGIGSFDLVGAYPDLDKALRALSDALALARSGSDAAALIGHVTAIGTAGRRAVDALDDIAADPIAPILSELRDTLQRDLLPEGLSELTKEFVGAYDAGGNPIAALEREIVGKFRAVIAGELDKVDGAALLPLRLRDIPGEALFDRSFRRTLDIWLAETRDVALAKLFGDAGTFRELAQSFARTDWRQVFAMRLAALPFDADDLTQRGRTVLAETLRLRALIADLESKGLQSETALAEIEAQTDRMRDAAPSALRRMTGHDPAAWRRLALALSAIGDAVEERDARDVLRSMAETLSLFDRMFLEGAMRRRAQTGVEELIGGAAGAIDGVKQLAAALMCQAVRTADFTAGKVAGIAPRVFDPDLLDRIAAAGRGTEGEIEALLKDLAGAFGMSAAGGPMHDPVLVSTRWVGTIARIERYAEMQVADLSGDLTADALARLETVIADIARTRRTAANETATLAASLAALLEDVAELTLQRAADTDALCPTPEAFAKADVATVIAAIRDFPVDRIRGILIASADVASHTRSIVDRVTKSFDVLRPEALGARLTKIAAEASDADRAVIERWIAKIEADLDELARGLARDTLDALTQTLHAGLASVPAVGGAAADVAGTVLTAKRTLLADLDAQIAALEATVDRNVGTVAAVAPMARLIKMEIAALRTSLGLAGTGDPAAVAAENTAAASVVRFLRATDALALTPDPAAVTRLLRDAADLPGQFATLARLPRLEGAGTDAGDLRRAAGDSAAIALAQVLDTLTEAATDVGQRFADALAEAIRPALGAAAARIAGTLSRLYAAAVDHRNEALAKLKGDDAQIALAFAGILGIGDLRHFLLVVDRRGQSAAMITEAKARLLATTTPPEDRLATEAAALSVLANAAGGDPISPLRALAASWFDQRPAPFVILDSVKGAVDTVLRADLSAVFDLTAMRAEIEVVLLSLLPTRITTKMTFSTKVKAFAGIFVPRGPDGIGTFSVEGHTSVDLRGGSVSAATVARLSPFDIRLLGEGFDAFTMSFSEAMFTVGSDRAADISLRFVDFVIGEQLAYLQDLANRLGQGGEGLYVEAADGFPGIAAGYRLNLPAIGLGAVTFLNVGIVVGAILPFDDRRAIFTVGVSTRDSPFIILAGVFGGGGHFTLFSDGEKLVGFDASFVFAGGGGLTFGPLTLDAYVSVGVFVRKFGDLTEISGDFFVGGKGRIAFFTISTALTVRTGQEAAGHMVGSATFSFSFSIGFAKLRYGVTVRHQEDKGFVSSGETEGDRATREGSLRAPRRVRLAALDGAMPGTASDDVEIHFEVPRIDDDFAAWSALFREPGALFDPPTGSSDGR